MIINNINNIINDEQIIDNNIDLIMNIKLIQKYNIKLYRLILIKYIRINNINNRY